MKVPAFLHRTVVLGFGLAAVALLTGWTTPYQPIGPAGGFAERQLLPGRYEVAFRGDADTPMDLVSNMYLYRCAELAVQHGFDIFRSMATGLTLQSTRAAGANRTARGVVQMGRYADVPSNVRVWDARIVLATLEPVVKAPDGKAIPPVELARLAMVPGRGEPASRSGVTLDDLQKLLPPAGSRP